LQKQLDEIREDKDDIDLDFKDVKNKDDIKKIIQSVISVDLKEMDKNDNVNQWVSLNEINSVILGDKYKLLKHLDISPE